MEEWPPESGGASIFKDGAAAQRSAALFSDAVSDAKASSSKHQH